MKGFINRQHTVWCGKCIKWEQRSANSVKEAEVTFRQLGWKKTKQHGWTCPDHVVRER